MAQIPAARIDSLITEQKGTGGGRKDTTPRPSIPDGEKSVAEPSGCLPKDDAAKDINSR